jgi:hypothetical protein
MARALTNKQRQRERLAQVRMQNMLERKHRNRLRLIILSASKDMVSGYAVSGSVGTADNMQYAMFTAMRAMWRDSLGVAGKRMLTMLKARDQRLELKFDIFGDDFNLHDDEDDTPSFEFFVNEYIEQHGGQKIASDITDETREQIMEMVSAGQQAALSTRDIVKDIISRLPEIAKYRAHRIARTEVHGATNYAHDAAARSLNLPMLKEWIASSQPKRTRKSHQEADGQQVELDGLFNVGMDKLRYAGDNRGSAKEVINCRCAIGYVVAD